MGSETHYLPDDLHEYVKELRDDENLDNNSQAVQLIVEEHRNQNL